MLKRPILSVISCRQAYKAVAHGHHRFRRSTRRAAKSLQKVVDPFGVGNRIWNPTATAMNEGYGSLCICAESTYNFRQPLTGFVEEPEYRRPFERQASREHRISKTTNGFW